MSGDAEVRAAGGVLWRRGGSDGHTVEVAVVHRPRYDDWSFAKGKLDPGETFAAAAVREVSEETGYDAALGVELPEVRYTDNQGRSKVVRWWAMKPTGGAFEANDEVDVLRWVTPTDAAALLTYPTDVRVLEALVETLDS